MSSAQRISNSCQGHDILEKLRELCTTEIRSRSVITENDVKKKNWYAMKNNSLEKERTTKPQLRSGDFEPSHLLQL
jgi:hypothetical protein